MNFKHILFPTDFSSCSEQALAHAAHLAHKNGADLHMLHVITIFSDDPHNPAHHFPGSDELKARVQDAVSSQFDKQTKDLNGEIKIHRIQRRGLSAAPTVLAYAQENDIDMIVMGTHGRRGMTRMLLGSVTEEVVRHAPCPVLSIRESKSKPSQVSTVDKILVPIDFSDFSAKALAMAKTMASNYGAALEVVHVIEQPVQPGFYMAGVGTYLELSPELRERSTKELKSLADKAEGPDVPMNLHVEEGHAAQQIVQFAEDKSCDMIIIPTHGLTGMAHFLLGSVAERVVRHAPCPVLTVKSPIEKA